LSEAFAADFTLEWFFCERERMRREKENAIPVSAREREKEIAV